MSGKLSFATIFRRARIDGLTALRLAWDTSYRDYNPKFLAYALATATWETNHTLQPVREIGLGRGKPYGVPDPITHETYYGRGYVQLTWKTNYAKMGLRLGEPHLVAAADNALIPAVAAKILFQGMIDGMFTGLSSGTFFLDRRRRPGGRATYHQRPGQGPRKSPSCTTPTRTP